MSYFRCWIIGLAFLATIINYLDRSALSYAIESLQQTFALTNADFGEIASAFGIGYLIMTFIGGVLVDKYGAHRIWALAAILWSLAAGMLGFATGFTMLLILRVALGMAEGPNFPALARVVADWLPMSNRATALAIGLAAVPFSSVLGAPLISNLIIHVGWRAMFVILGAAGFIWAILWFILFRDKPEHSSSVNPQELQLIQADHIAQAKQPQLHTTNTSWRAILFHPALISNNIAFFAFGYMLFFVLNWLPGYFEQVYNIKLKEIGLFLIFPWLLSTIFLMTGGLLSDWLWKKTQSIRKARSHIIWSCQLLSALCFIPIVMVHSLTVSITFISLGMAFGFMPNAVIYAINADLAKEKTATSLGIMTAYSSVAGILSPLLTGFITQITGNFNAAIYLMIILTLVAVISIIVFQHSVPRAGKYHFDFLDSN